MSVHYKFKAAKEYDTLPIDGLHISLVDLKDAIIHQKRLGKFACDLKVTNAETKQVYDADKDLIPKNTSLIIARIPIDPALRKFGDSSQEDKELLLSNPDYRMNTEGAEEAELIQRKIEEVPDITKLAGTEEEKIAVMMAQSTIKYHPSRYLRLRNTVMSGKVPNFYKCYKCHQGGHWVSNCPLNSQDVRKCTGIPSKFLEEVKDANTPGVMITATGKYVILRQKNMNEVKAKIRPQFITPPDDLICPMCKDVLKEAVLIPCCANAYCDDCIRIHLLDSDLQICPACNEKGIGPDTLIPNRYLRLKVEQFGLQYIIDDDENEEQLETKINSIVASPKVSEIESDNNEQNSKEADNEIEVLLPDKENTIKDVVEVLVPEKEITIKDVVEKETVEVAEETAKIESKILEEPLEEVKEKTVKAKKKKKEKKKKEKKSKKVKKEKKEKKEKKKKVKNKEIAEGDSKIDKTAEKDVSSENLMNEAICGIVDTSVPPPTYSKYGSQSTANLYDNLGRADATIPYRSQFKKREIEDTLSPFLDFLRKKDEEKKRKIRSPSSGTRYRGSRSRSREPNKIYSREQGSSSRSPSMNRSRSRSPHQRGSPLASKRSRRYSPDNHASYSPYKGGREIVNREYNPYQVFPPQEQPTEYYGSAEYMDQARYPRNPQYGQQYNRGYARYHDNNRPYMGFTQPTYPPNYQRFPQPEQYDYRRKTHRDYYQENRASESHPYSKARHGEEGYRAREGRRYVRSKSPMDEDRHRDPEHVRSYKSKEEYDRKHYGESSRDDYKKKSKYSSSPDYRQEDKRKSNSEDARSDRDHKSLNRSGKRSPGKDSRRRSRSPPKESTSKSSKGGAKESSSKLKSDQETHGKRVRSPSEYVDKKKVHTPSKDSPHEREVLEKKKDHSAKETKQNETIKHIKIDESEQKDEKDIKKAKKKKKEKKKKEKVKHKSKLISENTGMDVEGKETIQEPLSPGEIVDNQDVSNNDVYYPELSKWERDDEDFVSPMKFNESVKTKESTVVTSDVLKKAENMIFSKGGIPTRNLVPRKVYSDARTDVANLAEREKVDLRETKKKGSSIQITISSKTESQIGKPKSSEK